MKKTILLFLFSISFLLDAFTQQVNWQWAINAGGYSDDVGYSITTDNEGNIITGGLFNDIAYFGDDSIAAFGYFGGAFLSKIDSSGNFLWVRKITGTDLCWLESVTADNENNIYVTGVFTETIFFDTISITSRGNGDFFAAKYDKNGNPQWIKPAGGGGGDGDSRIANYSNNVYVFGSFVDTIFIDSNVLISGGGRDILLYNMDIDGNYHWLRRAGGAGGETARGLAINNDQKIYITGTITPGATFEDTLINVNGASDAYIAKYDTAGNFIWARSMGGNNHDYGISVNYDYNNNIYVTGLLNSTQAVFGNITVNCYGASDYYIAKLNPAGEFLWAKPIGAKVYFMDDNWNNSLICNENNDLFITGYFKDSLMYDGYTAYSAGSYDMFIMKVNSFGELQWVKICGDVNGDYSRSIARYNNNLYITGRFYNTLSFGTNSITSTGSADVFVAKLHEEPVTINKSTTNNQQSAINVYPNPADNYIIVTIPFNKEGISQIEFYDINGHCIKKENITNKSGKLKFNIANWQPGCYFVKYSSGDNYCTGKFFKL